MADKKRENKRGSEEKFPAVFQKQPCRNPGKLEDLSLDRKSKLWYNQPLRNRYFYQWQTDYFLVLEW